MASSKKKRVDDVEQDAEVDESGEEFDEDDIDSGDDDEEEPMEEVVYLLFLTEICVLTFVGENFILLAEAWPTNRWLPVTGAKFMYLWAFFLSHPGSNSNDYSSRK